MVRLTRVLMRGPRPFVRTPGFRRALGLRVPGFALVLGLLDPGLTARFGVYRLLAFGLRDSPIDLVLLRTSVEYRLLFRALMLLRTPPDRWFVPVFARVVGTRRYMSRSVLPDAGVERGLVL